MAWGACTISSLEPPVQKYFPQIVYEFNSCGLIQKIIKNFRHDFLQNPLYTFLS